MPETMNCPNCGGTGKKTIQGKEGPVEINCSNCGGSGKVFKPSS